MEWTCPKPNAAPRCAFGLGTEITMQEKRTPTHLRRTKWTKRAQLLLAILGAAFVVYRVVAVFMRRGL